ncbi:branched-chain amino acid aminotransferase [Peribacillus sp. B-H-3]|jgi:hypothetical protein|uniref:branched-chain amino acid aminotransferase n=1 Tax=Peribacillus sp. B-H-3 TaxID=3400420 RepID=UPI003B01AB75
MLSKQMVKFLGNAQNSSQGQVQLFEQEREYVQKHNLADASVLAEEKEKRFKEAYIERCNKESEEMIAEESPAFFEHPIAYFKEHAGEFIYVESKWFELIGADAVSFELDDVFGTYSVLLGLKLQKKFDTSIRDFLHAELANKQDSFELMFSTQDGLWDLNFALNDVSGFSENMILEDAFNLIYSFLFRLAEYAEKTA